MIVLAFGSLGFLIGNLVGLSAESTVSVLIPLLFTFGGGSAVALLPKLGQADRLIAATAVVSLSVFCLLGVYAGIVVSERQLLSSAPARDRRAVTAPARASIEERKYLRQVSFDSVALIDQRYKDRLLTATQAYEQLYGLVTRSP